MLIQLNCFDDTLHILLKQNMDITVRKTANFLSLLNFIRLVQVLIEIYNHTEWSAKVRNHFTFKHQSMNWP